jgi:hypothetical protein
VAHGSLPGPGPEQRELSDLKLDLTLTTDPDFLGYERSFYRVNAHRRGGVVIAFESAAITVDGVTSQRSKPVQPLFQLPSWARSVRLLYMLRGSSADYNSAILAGNGMDELEHLTTLVRADPSACRAYRKSICQWIPKGVAAWRERPPSEPKP